MRGRSRWSSAILPSCRCERLDFTHDLVGRILTNLGYRLHRVIISELKDDTFYAMLVLVQRDAATVTPGTERTIDCRPSDAIALSVQTGAPVFVAKEVFEAVAAE